MDIREKVALITGASAGIGLATAHRFATAGAKLALVARSADALNYLAEELQHQGSEAIALPADVRDQNQVRHVIEETVHHFGRLDVLINNAGQAAAGTIADLDPEDFRKILDLNVFGPLAAMQAVIPIMREQEGGLIINVSSMVSKMRIPGLAAYAATKAALNMLSDTARAELASEHIRVIAVYPRLTATDFGKHSLGNQRVRQQQRQGSPILTAPTPARLRDMLEDMVLSDLLGPAGDEEEEIEEARVHDRYLIGMLAPNDLQAASEEQDELAIAEEGSEDSGPTDLDATQTRSLNPSSMGISFCVNKDAPSLLVTVRWGQYKREHSQDPHQCSRCS